MGNFGNPASSTYEWCHRRAIYPTLLSGVTWIAQQNIFYTLLLQAMIVGLSIFIVVRRSSVYVGTVGVAVISVLLLRYATTDLFTSTMTENAGLIFGCLGFASLIGSSEKKSITWLVIGIVLFSVALNARAGAFFLLPCLVLWAGIAAHTFNKNVWAWMVAAALAATTGFALQAALVISVGGSASSSHGNFSYVIYGLSVGGLGWQQALIDHPELASLSDALTSKAIYALAWNNIKTQPELLMQGLLKSIPLFIAAGTYGFEKLGALAPWVKICWWAGWVPLFANAKKPIYLLIALASLGIIASTPFVLMDGGPRSFAATIIVDVIQIALGLFWIGLVVRHLYSELPLVDIPFNLETAKPEQGSIISLEGGLASILFALIAIPHFHLTAQPMPTTATQVGECQMNESRVITYIGKRSSIMMSFIDPQQVPYTLHEEFEKEKIMQGIPKNAWYRDQAIGFNGATLLSAYQLDQSDTSAPGPYWTTSDVPLSTEYYGRLVRLCIDKNKQEIIFSNSYRKLNSITVLD